MSGYTTAEVTINYLAHLGPAAAVTITLPVGTRCKRVDGEWAVDDEALLVCLHARSEIPLRVAPSVGTSGREVMR